MKWRFRRNLFKLGSIGLVVLFFTAGFLEGKNLPRIPNFIFWEYDHKEAFEVAKRENGIVFVLFYSADSDSCQRMERDTFSNPEVIQFSRGHVFLKLSAKKSKTLMERYQITELPTFLLLSHSGKEIFRESTYMSAAQFLEKMESFSPRKLKPNLQNRENLKFLLDYAKKSFNHREFFEATKALDYILYEDPNNEQEMNDEALLLFGTCLVYLYQLDVAEILLARLCKEHPNSQRVPDAMYILGEIYLQTNRINLGTGLLERLIREHPGHPMEQSARKALKRIKQGDEET